MENKPTPPSPAEQPRGDVLHKELVELVDALQRGECTAIALVDSLEDLFAEAALSGPSAPAPLTEPVCDACKQFTIDCDCPVPGPSASAPDDSYCGDCGTRQSDNQREYDKDCNCGGSFTTPDKAIARLSKQLRKLEDERPFNLPNVPEDANSPAPHLHPAMQYEGEVQPCDHQFHKQVTSQNTVERIAETEKILAITR